MVSDLLRRSSLRREDKWRSLECPIPFKNCVSSLRPLSLVFFDAVNPIVLVFRYERVRVPGSARRVRGAF